MDIDSGLNPAMMNVHISPTRPSTVPAAMPMAGPSRLAIKSTEEVMKVNAEDPDSSCEESEEEEIEFNFDIGRSQATLKAKHRETPWVFRSGGIEDLVPNGYYDQYLDMFPTMMMGQAIQEWIQGIGGKRTSEQSIN
jgi:hypothetical protein